MSLESGTQVESPKFLAGPGHPTLLNALIGASSKGGVSLQLKKIEALRELCEPPDIVSDLSVHPGTKLWTQIQAAGFRSGTLPIYSFASCDSIDPSRLLEVAAEQIEGGVSIVTIHPTASHKLIKLAESRRVPWTSRGGGMVIEQLARKSGINPYLKILPQLGALARAHGTYISLGATFRSANVFDSFDQVQREEIRLQLKLARELHLKGVRVIIESPGHAPPAKIMKIAKILSDSQFPIMPLGPIPTETATGFDHLSAAIGATLMGLNGAAHILACVTREEHTGGVPSLESTLEAVRAARICANIIDSHLLNETVKDQSVVDWRTRHHTCIVGRAESGCSRCGRVCPLKVPGTS